MRPYSLFIYGSVLLAGVPAAGGVRAAPVDFAIPAQSGADALLQFSQQAGVEVLFSYDDLRATASPGVTGRHEPAVALSRLLAGTGYAARTNAGGKYIVNAAAAVATGSIRGLLLGSDDRPVGGAKVILRGTRRTTVTGPDGRFSLEDVPVGTRQLRVEGPGFHPLHITRVQVVAREVVTLTPQHLVPADSVTQMAPFIVEASASRSRFDLDTAPMGPRRAAGNIDLPRTANDALPYQIYPREQIVRSGVIDLNEFLQRVVLENSSVEQSPPGGGFIGGGLNLSLRGYDRDETVILVNGRRMPEVMTSEAGALPPDVDFIPLSLVQQVEVLPVSASALYSGNPVGGVINIVLRPDMDATEVTATMTNRLGGFDAAHTSLAWQHGQSLLDGALRIRLSAAVSRSMPPTEGELGYRQAAARRRAVSDDRLFRATPNVRSADGTPLFGAGTPAFTSVAPGADGTGGLAVFAGRQGVRNLDFFDPDGGLAASIFSVDAPYGRKQRRTTTFASAVYDVFPWLQIGLDGAHARTVINRGYDVLTANLSLPASSPLNPFGQDVIVSLNEIAPRLGENYSESRTDFSSLVGGLLLKLPADWQLSLDAQYARNVARYRGLAEPDLTRWQGLVDEGLYQPLRDTQIHGPPDAFHDEVLIFQGNRGRFARIGDYETLEAAVRITHPSLPLPTGRGVLNAGADYRRNHMKAFTDERRYGDGTLAAETTEWSGRTLQRYSFFGELQAPLLPSKALPRWLDTLESSLALRYAAADSSRESNFAPTAGLKIGIAGGFTLRGSFTTSNRFPPPRMSHRIDAPTAPGSGLNFVWISDPRREEDYEVIEDQELNPDLRSESAITQTAGLIYQRGRAHRVRASIDYVDTHKTGEMIPLEAQAVVNLESLFPERVARAPATAGVPGPITSILTGTVNASSRRSRNWNLALDYAWAECLGGTVELRSRVVYFQSYDLQLYGNSPVVNQLRNPDGTAPSLLRYRAHFGAGWTGRGHGFGLEGQYFHSRILPLSERPAQGSDRIKPYWQFDAYLQADLVRWLPWKDSRYGLRGQVRVNNVFGFDPPKYANEGTGAGVLSYGDWRGRVYSVSVTAVF